jgi:hypothetical protein
MHMKRIVFAVFGLIFLISFIDGCDWRLGKESEAITSGSSVTNYQSVYYEASISFEPDKFTVTITDPNRNHAQPQTYSANSFEEFRQKYPDITKEYDLELDAQLLGECHYTSHHAYRD